MLKGIPKNFFLIVLLSLIGCARQNPRLLIINADDVGMSSEVNNATIDGVEAGVISSASVMVSAPAFKEMVSFIKEHPEISWGVHLTLTSEWSNYRWGPISNKEEVKSLIDEEGFFWRTSSLVSRHVVTTEAEQELRNQIQHALDLGIPVSHLDSHMYSLFGRPDLFKLYLKLSTEFEIPVLLFNKSSLTHLEERISSRSWQQTIKDSKFPIINFYDGKNYTVSPRSKEAYLSKLLAVLPAGVSLVALHPAKNSKRLTKIFRDAHRRVFDARIVRSAKVKKLLSKEKITLTNWNYIHAAHVD